MELSVESEMTTAEIARGVWGVLCFVALIVYLRWEGTPKDQGELTPPEVPKRKERRKGNG